jgi:methylglutaconyl-CoA hydratase
VQQVLDDVLSSSPDAIRRAKHLVQAIAMLPDDEARRFTIEAIADARTSDEGQEGLRAFLEKRQPTWASMVKKR